MVVVSIIFAGIIIPLVAFWAIIRNMAAAHRQAYADDVSAFEFAEAHPAKPMAAKPARKQAAKRVASKRGRTIPGHGRPHSAMLLR